MSLRFRRSVRLFPGVRLNFSRSGVSTTIGVRGATMTMGPRGTYANVGLPGSGLSYRTRISPPQGRRPTPTAPPSMPSIEPANFFLGPDATQLHSADISVLTSQGLSELKQLINEAAVKRRSLLQEVKEKERSLSKATSKLHLARFFIVRIFTTEAIPGLMEKRDVAAVELDGSRTNLEGCCVEVDFGLTEETLASYAAMVRYFEEVVTSKRIWDITAVQATNRVAERTIATQSVHRVPVTFDTVVPTLIRTKHRALRLGNVSGKAIHLLPGFIMMTEPSGDFALLEYAEVKFEFSTTRFNEEGQVPSDSEVIGQTWKKANKDGSPDRRFKVNHPIPIVRYGEVMMLSPTGLLEVYQFSNYVASRAFADAFGKHSVALAGSVTQEHAANDDPVTESEDLAEGAEVDTPHESAGTPNLTFDWIALFALIVAIAVAGAWIYRKATMV